VKNFQISYSPNAWKQERKTWRAVIFLNLVRSIRRILAILDEVHVAAGGHSYHYNTTERLDETLEADDDAASVPTNLGVTSTTSKSGTPRKRSHTVATNGTAISGQSNTSGSTSSIVSTGLGTLPSHLLELSLRLSPLGLVEESLIAALSSEDPASDDFEATRLGSKDLLKGKANGREAALSAVQWRRTLKTKISGGRTSSSGLSMWGRKKNRDSGSSGSITSRSTPRPGTVTDVNGANGSSNVMNGDGEKTMGDVMDENVQYDILGTLQACADDMIRLWKDPYVRDVLKKRRFRPQDSSGL
jgi:guanine nucleotide-binding protein subunit alpha